MKHLICASTSRLVPAASVEGFFFDRYAVRSRGSCLCSERSLIKWVILYSGHIFTVCVKNAVVYISKAETVSQHYCTLH